MISSKPRLEAKPYKGPESYQVEDSELFFGRDREADQLIAKILSSRFTLLHAQSGAGKTSLLNARIIPGLESRGWSACRILPQNDPIESVRATTLKYVLPPPQSELRAIERARERLSTSSEHLTLGELLIRYDGLNVRDPLRRALVAPIEISEGVNKNGGVESFTPYFCRLLRSTIEVDSFVEHLTAVLQEDSGRLLTSQISSHTEISELTTLLSSPVYAAAYEQLLSDLDVPVSGLSAFFEHLIEIYGQRRCRFTLVLILDQFEELFTRFIDPGPTLEKVPDLPDWQLRWEFFEQLESLYGTEGTSTKDGEVNQPGVLPIRYVISMRDEYIAQLDPLRRFIGAFEDSSYHLSLLEKSQAKAAIQYPATLFGYSYSGDCYDKIIKQLTKENRFVEPAHLQLVCEKLWNERGRDLAVAGKGTNGASQRAIELDVFVNLGETKGILKSFFYDFINDLDKTSRLETLELLEPLVTASGTRNIIERDRLIYAPFRDGARRSHLLDELVNRTIVRTERRLGGYFIEITHEFLIAPILEAIRDEVIRNVEYSRLRWALRTLERFQGFSFGGGPARLLSMQEFLALHEHREAITWNAWSSELMLRSALSLTLKPDVLAFWLRDFDRYDQTLDASLVIGGKDTSGQENLLSLAELRVINDQRSSLKLSADQVDIILRSELVWAVDAERDDVAHWVGKMKSYA